MARTTVAGAPASTTIPKGEVAVHQAGIYDALRELENDTSVHITHVRELANLLSEDADAISKNPDRITALADSISAIAERLEAIIAEHLTAAHALASGV